ncbi:MAG: hypothetical protein P4M15_09280 [Alphaproteobacteria bacterium]|nr:hypothetical protein [Alphaproteobacteria bacterium]
MQNQLYINGRPRLFTDSTGARLEVGKRVLVARENSRVVSEWVVAAYTEGNRRIVLKLHGAKNEIALSQEEINKRPDALLLKLDVPPVMEQSPQRRNLPKRVFALLARRKHG